MAADVNVIQIQITIMREQVSKDYPPTVKTEVSSIISSLLREKYNDQTTTDELEVLHNHSIIHLSAAFEKEEEAFKKYIHEYSTNALAPHQQKYLSTKLHNRSYHRTLINLWNTYYFQTSN